MAIIDEYNTILAQAEERDRYIELETVLRKAQTASWESADQYAGILIGLREADAAALADAYERTRAAAKWDLAQSIKKGEINQATGRPYTEADMDAYLTEMERRQQEKLAASTAAYNDALVELYDMLFSGSDFGDAWEFIKRLYGEGRPVNEFGAMDLTGVTDQINGDLAEQLRVLGGIDLGGLLGEGGYDHAGLTKMLELLALAERVWEKSRTNQLFGETPAASDYFTPAWEQPAVYGPPAPEIDFIGPPYFPEEVTIDALANTVPAEEAIDALNGTDIELDGIVDGNDIQRQLSMRRFSIIVQPQVQGGGIAGAVRQMTMYAEGGRADVPSIFGDRGPEWAIPESHDRRTAELFNAARAASGFTWGELMERAGAFSGAGGASGGSVQILYSPTIIANDADGVEQKLREDKRRFERWYKDYQRREAMEVYA